MTALKYNFASQSVCVKQQATWDDYAGAEVRGMRAGETELFDYSFADFAEHSGGMGIKVTEPSELGAAVDKALKSTKPTIVDIDTDPIRFL